MRRFLGELFLTRNFLLFVALFAYIQSIQIRLLFSSNYYIFTPEAAIITFLCACILYGIMGTLLLYFQRKYVGLTLVNAFSIFVVSLVLYLIIINSLSLLLAFLCNTIERNFNQKSFLLANSQNILDVCIYGGFFLAHYYYQRSRKDSELVSVYNQALAESKVAQLKAQLNPHFLFNNLNVLDQLIEEDKKAASSFLNDFADLYRYLLETSDKKLVELDEELDFACNYFRLMCQRYGSCYTLDIQKRDGAGGCIPPLTLQLLLENAFQHNLGRDKSPVNITIDIGDRLLVRNNIVPKQNPKQGGGRGLLNLREQYLLLTPDFLEIESDEGLFSVSLPLIRSYDKCCYNRG